MASINLPLRLKINSEEDTAIVFSSRDSIMDRYDSNVGLQISSIATSPPIRIIPWIIMCRKRYTWELQMQPHGECEPPIGTLDITLDYVSVIVERWMVFPFLKWLLCDSMVEIFNNGVGNDGEPDDSMELLSWVR